MPRLTDSARIQLDANRNFPAGGTAAPLWHQLALVERQFQTQPDPRRFAVWQERCNSLALALDLASDLTRRALESAEEASKA